MGNVIQAEEESNSEAIFLSDYLTQETQQENIEENTSEAQPTTAEASFFLCRSPAGHLHWEKAQQPEPEDPRSPHHPRTPMEALSELVPLIEKAPIETITGESRKIESPPETPTPATDPRSPSVERTPLEQQKLEEQKKAIHFSLMNCVSKEEVDGDAREEGESALLEEESALLEEGESALLEDVDNILSDLTLNDPIQVNEEQQRETKKTFKENQDEKENHPNTKPLHQKKQIRSKDFVSISPLLLRQRKRPGRLIKPRIDFCSAAL
mmetsp:Transcript_21637/g.29725  ORF Transcript_21637/g.29725 Transcript_21637/m.29725 type:complete len:268 (-) Transcript_21637:106-909(-)